MPPVAQLYGFSLEEASDGAMYPVANEGEKGERLPTACERDTERSTADNLDERRQLLTCNDGIYQGGPTKHQRLVVAQRQAALTLSRACSLPCTESMDE